MKQNYKNSNSSKSDGLEALTNRVKQTSNNFQNQARKALEENWVEFKKSTVLSDSEKWTIQHQWEFTFQGEKDNIKLIKEHEKLSENDNPSDDDKKKIRVIERKLSFDFDRKGNSRRGNAMINCLKAFIKQRNENSKNPFGLGLVWNQICIYHVNKWIPMTEKTFDRFFRNKIALSVGIKKSDMTGSRLITNTINETLLKEEWFDLTLDEERLNMPKKIVFQDITLNIETMQLEPHDLNDFQIGAVDCNFQNQVKPLLKYTDDQFEKHIRQRIPNLWKYISTSFENFLDFQNVCEFKMQAISQIELSYQCLYVKGFEDSGKSLLMELFHEPFPDYSGEINFKDICDSDIKIRGLQFASADGKCSLFDPDLTNELIKIQFLKKVISNEDLKVHRKYKELVDLEIRVRFMIVSNYILNIVKAGREIKKRLHAIQLKPIDKNDIDANLKSKILKDQSEFISVVVAIGLRVFKNKNYKLSYNERSEELLKTICGDDISYFIELYKIKATEQPTEQITKDYLFAKFKQHLIREGSTHIYSKKEFLLGLESNLRANYPIFGTSTKKITIKGDTNYSNAVSIIIENQMDLDRLQ